MKLLIELGRVPEGSSITKKTGTKQYTVKDEIRIYVNEKEYQIIKANQGCRLLIDHQGLSHSAMSSDVEVVWEVDRDDLVYMINNNEI